VTLSSGLSKTNGSTSRSSILLIDYDADVSKLVEESLLRSGFKVSAFTDAILALKDYKVNCKTCSLILSDIRMPGMDGYEFVKKAKEIDNQAKIVLMTAFDIHDRESHDLLSDIKVDGFLRKPFSTQHLNDVIKLVHS